MGQLLFSAVLYMYYWTKRLAKYWKLLPHFDVKVGIIHEKPLFLYMHISIIYLSNLAAHIIRSLWATKDLGFHRCQKKYPKAKLSDFSAR